MDNEIVSVLYKAQTADELYQQIDKHMNDDFNKLIEGIVRNYEKRNISLIEFLDYYQTYKENILQMESLKLQRINAFQELNYIVGKDVL